MEQTTIFICLESLYTSDIVYNLSGVIQTPIAL